MRRGESEVIEYREPGERRPCINLVVISDNENAQDQYGRQIDERLTSVVHQLTDLAWVGAE